MTSLDQTPVQSPPLRGRTRELSVARAALADSGVRLVVITGPSGAGKSALAEAALEAPELAHILIGAGRFAPNNAYGMAPLVAAIDLALARALEDFYDPDAALDALAGHLGDTAQALAGLSGGALGQLAARAVEPGRGVNIAAAAERLAQALVEICAWLAALRGQVLLLLDDWGRGGPETTALLLRLLHDVSALRLLATERPEEAFDAIPSLPVLRLDLTPPDADARLMLLVDRLEGDRAVAAAVAEFLGPETVLPIDLVDALSVLKSSGALRRETHGWTFEAARAAEAMGGAVAERLVASLPQAGAEAPTVALVLALFGGAADPAELSAGTGLPHARVDELLAGLAGLGVVRWTRQGVGFSHDRILAAVVASVDEDARRAGACALAEALRAGQVRPAAFGAGAAMLNARLAAGLATADADAWSPLCAEGAEQARIAGAGGKAAEWADAALELARRTGEIAPEILREAVYAAVERADLAGARTLVDQMLAVSTSLKARAEADEMRVLVRRVAGDINGALGVAREALARFGVRMPDRADRLRLAFTALRVLTTDVRRARRHGRMSPEQLEIYAPMMRTLNSAGSLLYEQEPMRAVLFAVTGVPVRLVAGTASGAGTYGVLCAAFGAFRQAERWATLSDELQGPGQPLRAMAMQYATNFGHAMIQPRLSAEARVVAMERMAYAEGDLGVAAYANRRRALDAVFGDNALADVAADLDVRLETARRLADRPTLVTVEAMRQFTACLAEAQATPLAAHGTLFRPASLRALAARLHHPRAAAHPCAAGCAGGDVRRLGGRRRAARPHAALLQGAGLATAPADLVLRHRARPSPHRPSAVAVAHGGAAPPCAAQSRRPPAPGAAAGSRGPERSWRGRPGPRPVRAGPGGGARLPLHHRVWPSRRRGGRRRRTSGTSRRCAALHCRTECSLERPRRRHPPGSPRRASPAAGARRRTCGGVPISAGA
jgi:hypothetical protein